MKTIIRMRRSITAIVLFLIVTASLLYVIYPVKAEPVDQYQAGWKLIRETADEDGATFAAVYDLTGVGITNSAFGNFANKDSSTVANGGPYQIRSYSGTGIGTEFQSSGKRWQFVFCGKNFNNVDDTFSFNLIGWSRINGMLQDIAEGDGVLGTQAVIIYPDGGDALGETFSVTNANYTHGTKTLTVTDGGFDGGVVNQLVRVVSSNESNLTSAMLQITTFTDANTIIVSGAASSTNITTGDIIVQSNPAFWADTITLDEVTKWRSDANEGTLAVLNSGGNEVAILVADLTGIEWIQFVIYAADAATNEESGAITIYGRPY